jgi:hypothetical protein
MATYRKVSEIVELLQDRAAAEAQIKKVDKGEKKKDLSYIPWWGTVEMLNDVFGVFGWDAVPEHYVSDTERGIYIVDGYLEVRALDDETGVLVSKRLPGRGMGCVPQSALNSADAHDMAGKGARSDFISVAAKGLGNHFGIFLYDKADPANGRNFVASTSSQGASPATQVTTQTKTDTKAPAPSADGRIGFASEKQLVYLHREHWTDAQVAELSKDELKRVMDGIFGKGDKISPPKTVQGKANLQLVQPTGTEEF